MEVQMFCLFLRFGTKFISKWVITYIEDLKKPKKLVKYKFGKLSKPNLMIKITFKNAHFWKYMQF